MSLIIGVDAGGSGTAYALERDGALTQFEGAAINLRSLGVREAVERIASALGPSLRGEAVEAMAVGAAGAGDAELARTFAVALRERFAGARVSVEHDASIALRAAVPEGDGLVLIAGTGSIAYALVGGAAYRAGGYGALVGDEGSGYAIGRATLAHALRASDGRGPDDGFARDLRTHLGASDAAQIVARVYAGGDPVAMVASLAPFTIERANAGERPAAKIVQTAAVDLAELVKAVARAAGIADRDLPLVLSGGLLGANSLLTYLIETRIGNDLPSLEIRKGAPAPVMGALAIARGLLGS